MNEHRPLAQIADLCALGKSHVLVGSDLATDSCALSVTVVPDSPRATHPWPVSRQMPSGDDREVSAIRFNAGMTGTLRVSLGNMVRGTRLQLDITQAELARVVGLTRAYMSAIELGRANPTIDVIARIAGALGLDLEVRARAPVVIGTRQRDIVHARCSAYVHRRMVRLGLACAREVEIAQGRSHGWIDLLVFDHATGTLYVIEVKTILDDIGAVERQLGWYERVGPELARLRGWRVRRVRVWLLVLASEDVERCLRANSAALRTAFPVRAGEMRRQVTPEAAMSGDEGAGRGLALINPSSRRRDWLMASRLDGRRSPAPFRDYADAAGRLARVGG